MFLTQLYVLLLCYKQPRHVINKMCWFWVIGPPPHRCFVLAETWVALSPARVWQCECVHWSCYYNFSLVYTSKQKAYLPLALPLAQNHSQLSKGGDTMLGSKHWRRCASHCHTCTNWNPWNHCYRSLDDGKVMIRWWEEWGESKGECEASVWGPGLGPGAATRALLSGSVVTTGSTAVYSSYSVQPLQWRPPAPAHHHHPHPVLIWTLERKLMLLFSWFCHTTAFSKWVSFINVILEEVSLSVACVHCHPLPCRAECQCTAATRHSASISSYLGPAPAPRPAWWRPFIATSANYPTKETNGIKKSKPMYPQWQPNSIDNDVRGTEYTFLHRKVFVVRTNLRMYTVWFLPYASLSLCCSTAHDEG